METDRYTSPIISQRNGKTSGYPLMPITTRETKIKTQSKQTKPVQCIKHRPKTRATEWRTSSIACWVWTQLGCDALEVYQSLALVRLCQIPQCQSLFVLRELVYARWQLGLFESTQLASSYPPLRFIHIVDTRCLFEYPSNLNHLNLLANSSPFRQSRKKSGGKLFLPWITSSIIYLHS